MGIIFSHKKITAETTDGGIVSSGLSTGLCGSITSFSSWVVSGCNNVYKVNSNTSAVGIFSIIDFTLIGSNY